MYFKDRLFPQNCAPGRSIYYSTYLHDLCKYLHKKYVRLFGNSRSIVVEIVINGCKAIFSFHSVDSVF